MGQSVKGDSGVMIETIMNDRVIIVGDHANVNPSVYTDPVGIEINNYSVSSSGGITQAKSAIPKNTAIDNSGDFHGGTFTINCMNKLSISTAAGGIDIMSAGNIRISAWGGIFNIIGTKEANINGEVIKINSTNITMLTGTSLYVDTASTIFNKNVIFGNNVLANGGVVVNGELIARHITTLRSVSWTSESDELKGYAIPGAEFLCTIEPLGILTTPAVEGSPCEVLPGQAMITLTPIDQTPIVAIPPHDHIVNGPAMTLVDGPTDLFSEMQKGESETPLKAKPNLPNDMSLNDMQNKFKSKIQKRVTDFVKKILPF